VTAENADPRRLTEKQDEAHNFHEENTVTRGEGFSTDRAARRQRTRRPIDNKDQPGNLNEQWR